MEKKPTRMIKQIKIIGAPHPAEFSRSPINKDPDHAPTRFDADIIPKNAKLTKINQKSIVFFRVFFSWTTYWDQTFCGQTRYL